MDTIVHTKKEDPREYILYMRAQAILFGRMRLFGSSFEEEKGIVSIEQSNEKLIAYIGLFSEIYEIIAREKGIHTSIKIIWDLSKDDYFRNIFDQEKWFKGTELKEDPYPNHMNEFKDFILTYIKQKFPTIFCEEKQCIAC